MGSCSTPLDPFDHWYPFFPYADLLPEHINSALSALLQDLEHQLSTLEASKDPPTWDNTLAILEECQSKMEAFWGPLWAIRFINRQKEFDPVLAEASKNIVGLSMRFQHSTAIYLRLKTLRKSHQIWDSGTPEQHKAVEIWLRDGELAGVHLNSDRRQELVQIKQQLSRLSNNFVRNIMEARRSFHLTLTDPDDLVGVPEAVIKRLSRQHNERENSTASTMKSGPWMVLFTDIPTFLMHSPHEWLRKKLFLSQQSLCSDGKFSNSEHVAEILQLRHKRAILLGFKNHLELSLATSMIDSSEQAWKFLEEILENIQPSAVTYIQKLSEFKKNEGGSSTLQPWDVGHYSFKIKKDIDSQLNYSEDRLPLSQVLDELFALCRQLFGIQIEPVDLPDNCVWDQNLLSYLIKDIKTAKELAWVIMDLEARPGKKAPGGRLMNVRVHQINPLSDSDVATLPLSYLCCDFSRQPSDNNTGPGELLLNWYQCKTLFHEFGHALQNSLSTVTLGSISGTSKLERDAVELTSLFMEQWLSYHPFIERWSQGAFKNAQIAERKGRGYAYLLQVITAMLDLKIHEAQDDTSLNIQSCYEEIVNNPILTELKPYLMGYNSLCYSMHFNNDQYAGCYYGYLWSEMISYHSFATFASIKEGDRQGLRRVSESYRDLILSRGSCVDTNHALNEFMKNPTDVKSWLKQL